MPTPAEPAAKVRGHVADRLLTALERKGAPACVGIDPVLEKLPRKLRARGDSDNPRLNAAGAFAGFIDGLLDAVAPHVACVKFQAACFERYGAVGVACLEHMIPAARERDLEVILDAKRGDIGISAAHYAVSAFGDPSMDAGERDRRFAQWLTVNAYLGADGLVSFVEAGGGAFALVRTSNPSSDSIQSRQIAGDGTVAELVAGVVAQSGEAYVGASGYSALGAVVGATKAADIERLRALMPQQVLLVPGVGAQGATAEEIRGCFDERGRGAVITASRSVIYAFEPDAEDWTRAVGEAAARFADEIGRAAGLR